MKSIAIINYLGGVGKSTFSWLMARYVAEKMQKKVLLIAIDPQLGITRSVFLEKDKGLLNKEFELWYNLHKSNGKTLFDAVSAYECCKKDHYDFALNSSLIYRFTDNLHFIPATMDLYWLDYDIENKECIKKFASIFLNKLENSINFTYDYVFFDCPPHFNALSYSVISSSDLILIPVNPDVFASKTINLLIEGLFKRIKPWTIKKIAILMNKAKTINMKYLDNDSKKFLHEIKLAKSSLLDRGMDIDVFDSFIPMSEDIASAMNNHEFPNTYAEFFKKVWSNILDDLSESDVNILQ